MPGYTFSEGVVLIEATGQLAIGATGVFRAATGGDPVTIYDLNDSVIPSVAVGPLGVRQAFKADIPRGLLDFGSVVIVARSDELMDAAFEAQAISEQAALDAAAAATSSQAAAAAAAAAEGSAAAAAASAEAVPDAVQDIVAAQITAGAGVDKVLAAGNNTLTLSVLYGDVAGTAVQGDDERVTDGQPDTVAAIRRLAREAGAAAPGVHGHPVTDLEDVASFILDLLSSATNADARAILGVGDRAHMEYVVFWEENGVGTKWGTVRPTGYKRVKFAANGAANTEDPALTIGTDVDVWEQL